MLGVKDRPAGELREQRLVQPVGLEGLDQVVRQTVVQMQPPPEVSGRRTVLNLEVEPSSAREVTVCISCTGRQLPPPLDDRFSEGLRRVAAELVSERSRLLRVRTSSDLFDEWLARFRSKRRNQIKRERREVAESGVAIETLVGDAIPDALFEPMFRFYLATVRGRMWGRQYLNRRFFELLRERWKQRLCFVVARQDGEPIAGTFNVQKGDALWGRYWGATRDVRHLHFEVCYYRAIEHCIASGLARFEPGAGGEYKQVRGFDGQPTWSLHWLAEPRLRAAVSRFLAEERERNLEGIEWLREHSALKTG